MDDTDGLLSIGAFARRVGLAPSALRFYDDCGVLRPAFVDEATGYRYYRPGQEPRAVLLRRLRKVGMPLTEASVVLDGTREEARAVLERHTEKAREMAAAAQSAIEEILRDLSAGAALGTMARVGGAELSSAVRQVVPAVASSAVAEKFPILGGVLVELDGQEVRLVATDRYRLAIRTLRPHSLQGGPRQVDGTNPRWWAVTAATGDQGNVSRLPDDPGPPTGRPEPADHRQEAIARPAGRR